MVRKVPAAYRTVTLRKVMFVVDNIVDGRIDFLPEGTRGGMLLLAYYIWKRERMSTRDTVEATKYYWSYMTDSQQDKWIDVAEQVNDEAEDILNDEDDY